MLRCVFLFALLSSTTAIAQTSQRFPVWTRGAQDQIQAWNAITTQAQRSCLGWRHYNMANRQWKHQDCWWQPQQSYGVNLENFFNPNLHYSNPGTWLVPQTTYTMSCHTDVYCSN